MVSNGYVTAEETTEGTSLYKLYFPANPNHSLLKGQLFISEEGGSNIAQSNVATLSSNAGFFPVYAENTPAGTYFIKAGFLLASDTQKGCVLYSDNFTVSQLPTINNLYTSPTSAQAGTEFLFYAPLSGALPSGYSVQIEWYDGEWKFREQMIKNSSTQYYYYRTINKAGSRLFRVAIFKGDTQVSDWKYQSFTVTEIPVNHAPSVAKYSADTSATVGGTVTVKVTATDPDNNLATVQINWGDAGSTASLCTQYSGDIYRCTHTYQNIGTYIWAVTAYDHGDPTLTSNVVSGSIAVQENVPSTGTLYTDPSSAQAGTVFRFFAPLSSSLPGGYSLQIEWYDGDWKFREQMLQYSSTRYYFDRSITKAGTRQFRVAVFNGTTQVSSWKSATFTVTEIPINHAPSVSKYSADTSAEVGETVTVQVTATDQDGNLGTVQINWGDSGSAAEQCSKYSGEIYNCTHSYQNAGTYTWTVTAYDNGNPALQSNTVTGNISIENQLDILSFLNTDPLVSRMNLNANLTAGLSRSDAVVLIDRMRILENSSFDKEMSEYISPFADVPDDAEYLSSLMHLAYYHSNSFNLTPIDKYNELFNPLHHMTREEFLKVALTSFDIPKQSYNLSSTFSDSTEMSDWATKYFETAVYYGIILGNNGKLLARDKISVQEGLQVLERIKQKFDSNYPFSSSSFQAPGDFDIENMFRKSIGVEYEPSSYKPEATPIEITGYQVMFPDAGNNYIILTARSEIDLTNGASDYYRWETNAGYFKQHPDSPNFKTVYFYPTSTEPLSDYSIYLTGWDNLSYVSHHNVIIEKDLFTYNEDRKAVSSSEVDSSPFSFTLEEGALTATKSASINFTEMDVKKTNIDLSVDHVVVEMNDGINKYILYSNTPNTKRATFIVPDISSLYGQNVVLEVTVYTQNVKYQKTVTVQYRPIFKIYGEVINTGLGSDAEYVYFKCEKIYLDEDNIFSIEIDNRTEIQDEILSVYSGSEENNFKESYIDLTYANPEIALLLIGETDRSDIDNDGIPDQYDAFPYDPTETTDTDSDGIGDNADTDDDNDGMPDEYEIAQGFNPYNALDANDDFDGDGFTNLEEYQAGTNPLDKDDYPTTLQKDGSWLLFLPAILSASQQPFSETVLYNDLMWQKADAGVFLDWWKAGEYCEDLELDGYTDWRMPTFDELNGLVVCSNGAPTPPPKFSFLGCRDAVGDYTTPTMDSVFEGTYFTSPYIGYGIYWTSTENGTQTDYAWIISFNYGQNAAVEKIEDSLYTVRCVRDL